MLIVNAMWCLKVELQQERNPKVRNFTKTTLPMDLADIKTRILVVTVWAYDKHDNLEAVGEVAVDFEEIDLIEGEALVKDLEEAHQVKYFK